MALTLHCDTRKAISIGDYVEYVRSHVDLTNLESLAASAPMLRALANDRTLVVNKLNAEIAQASSSPNLLSAQTIYLGGAEGFYVRAAVWPSSAAVAGGRVYQDKFAYHLAHDHNFTFLTVNYLGPGYETEIYEYDYEKIGGYVGEPIDLRFLEKTRFGQGTVMLYRANQDVHIQYPPVELTITLNLMVSLRDVATREQFYFDPIRKIISEYPAETDPSKRVSLLGLVAQLGDESMTGLLDDVAQHHPCRRTRLAAFEALSAQRPAEVQSIWELACRDPSPLVGNAARRKLDVLAEQNR